MAERQVMQVGPSVLTQSANRRELSAHLDRGAGLREEGGDNQTHQVQTQVRPLHEASRVRDSAGPAASSCFKIYEESQSATARPAGNSENSPNALLDDVFLHPDERGLCLQIQYPPAVTRFPGCGGGFSARGRQSS